MILILTSSPHTVLAQSFKLIVPSGNIRSLKQINFIEKDSTFKVGDTCIRVVQSFMDNQKQITYKIRLTKDSSSRRLTYIIIDSLKIDTSYKLQLLKDNNREPDTTDIKWVLIKSDNIYADYPIEDIYFNRKSLKDRFSSITKDSSSRFSFLDSAKRKEIVKLNGNITITAQASDNKFADQTIPQNFVRGQVNLNLTIAGLPFNGSYYYTTESNTGVNRINTFRLSFNHQQFYQNLKNKMDKKIELDRLKQINTAMPYDVKAIEVETMKLKHELNTPSFKEHLAKWDKIIELGELDTSFKSSYKYKRAINKRKEFDEKRKRLEHLEALVEKLKKYRQLADIDANINQHKLSKPKNFRRAAERFGFATPTQSLFLSVKKLDLGTFDPDYTMLVLSGVSLTGVNIEVNPGWLYGAFTWGKAVANFDNPFNIRQTLAGGRNIIAGRVGIGNKDKFLLATSILKGTDDSRNSIRDSFYNFYLPSNNHVVGLDFKYRINEGSEIGFEYARSESRQIENEETNLRDLALRNRYSNAILIFANTQFNKNTSRIRLMARSVDPYYYSFGTPFLRRDNFRIESKAEQLFWKRQLTFSITYRRDQDNIHRLKEGTSINNSFLFTTQIRIKKLPYFILTYSPNYQQFFSASQKRIVLNNVKMYNAICGYTYQGKKVVINSMYSFTKQFNETNQTEWSRFHINQHAISEVLMFKMLNLTLNFGANYIEPLHSSDTGRVVSGNINLTKGLFKNKIQLLLGGRYQQDFGIETRYIVEAGTNFSLGWGISTQLHVERHFITSTTITNNKDMTLGRLTILKAF